MDFRLSEFPSLKERPEDSTQNGSTSVLVKSPPKMPKLTPVTGTLTVKLLGAEGLLDFLSIRTEVPGIDVLSPIDKHRPGTFSGHSRTLPGRSSHGSKDTSMSPSSPSAGATGFVRRGSKHTKNSASLHKRHSGDIVDDMQFGEEIFLIVKIHTRVVVAPSEVGCLRLIKMHIYVSALSSL